MRTKSCWGYPPSRLYKFIQKVKPIIPEHATVCVVGASDGKFVFPFLRQGFDVTAVELDEVALYGGLKMFPVRENGIEKMEYVMTENSPKYQRLLVKEVNIEGLVKRAEKEDLLRNLHIKVMNYYKEPVTVQYDIVFTSCSIPYECNLDISIDSIMATLKSSVKINGYLYMDYLMPLEDRHTWKTEHYFRSGEIKRYFESDEWAIQYSYEQKKPIFEVAHVDRPEDHFHRFGYILAKRLE